MKYIIKIIVISLLTGFTLVSCAEKKDEFDLIDFLIFWFFYNQSCTLTAPAAASADPVSHDQLFIQTDGELKAGLFPSNEGYHALYYKDYQGAYLVEGDMLFDKVLPLDHFDSATETDQQESVGINNSSYRWTGKVVNYQISTANTTMVLTAIRHWEAQSTFRFINSTATNYITFNNDSSGCSSYVGKIGGNQAIQVEDACGVGATAHEIGHALGLYHEQTRTDRDSYVNIHFDQIQSGKESNFQVSSDAVDNGPYDYTSIMHYGSTYFATGSSPTITKKDGSLIIPNRSALTTCDVNGATQLHDG